MKLDPADYMAWVDQPSTGHPTMFPSSFVERLTCTEWCAAGSGPEGAGGCSASLRACAAAAAAGSAGSGRCPGWQPRRAAPSLASGTPRAALTTPNQPTPLLRRYVVPLLWLPVAAAYMWRGVQGGGLSPAMLPVTTLLGVLIWQLMEYSIHK